ncbi:flavodoxin [Lactonifactor longoviformis]|uniref:flavodoxin n=1 Tax=Lactonifactor longoviformis TaxID=341220 RepID=UPI0036F26589
MKKLTVLFLSIMLVLGLAACGNNNTNNTEPSTTETPTTDTSETEAADTESTGGKTLVVYYSASGNTENVSNVIAETLGADLFELEPVEPYSNDDLNWTNDDSRVTREHENEDERDVELVSATVDNWSEYDTIFIGYPIWWGIAAWPVDEFIETNDFTGKTVIPFATSASSGMGQSGELLAEMAGTGDWQEGQRFRSGASEDDIVAWVEGLGL